MLLIKNKLILLIIVFFTIFLFYFDISFAGIIDITDPSGDIQGSSINENGDDIINNIESAGITILSAIKVIISGILIIYVVYIGATMIMSMGSNEEDTSSAKRQIRYTLVAIVLINIPGTIYDALNTNGGSAGGSINNSGFIGSSISGVFVNSSFISIVNDIIFFLEIIVFIIAIFMFVLAGIWIMTSRGREEKMKEGKNKLLYGVLGLIFVGMIETWKSVAFTGDTGVGFGLFGMLFQIALFFVGVTVIFFLTLAGYYYITSAGDEEKTKKAKSIIVNTFIAIIILLASYTFLIDLLNL